MVDSSAEYIPRVHDSDENDHFVLLVPVQKRILGLASRSLDPVSR
jgi:hypothetical protein